MRTILQMKHWQLFSILFVIPFVLVIAAYGYVMYNMVTMIESDPQSFADGPEQMFRQMMWVYVPIIAATLLNIAWQWSVGHQCQLWIPERLRLNTTLFKVALLVPVLFIIVYALGMPAYMSFMLDGISTGTEPDPGSFVLLMVIFMVLGLVSMAASFYCFYFVARSFKTAELQKATTFGEYVGEFFMTWFLFVGVWIMQPKLNKWLGSPPEEGDSGFVDLITD